LAQTPAPFFFAALAAKKEPIGLTRSIRVCVLPLYRRAGVAPFKGFGPSSISHQQRKADSAAFVFLAQKKSHSLTPASFPRFLGVRCKGWGRYPGPFLLSPDFPPFNAKLTERPLFFWRQKKEPSGLTRSIKVCVQTPCTDGPESRRCLTLTPDDSGPFASPDFPPQTKS
jgi:hypothetical protein